jgi:integrase/recombinase XerC
MQDVVAQYLTWIESERGLLPNTVKAYAREIRSLEASCSTPIEEMTTAEIRAHMNARGGAPATRARRFAAITSFFRYVVRILELRDDDPTLRLSRVKVRPGVPKPLEDKAGTFAKLKPIDQLIAIFLAETGLRISEACSLNVQTPVPDVVRVTGKGDKVRLVPLEPVARAALDWLGGSMPHSVRTIQRRFQAAGFTPHRCRHTLATELIEAGADLGDVQELLGHASANTTKVYAQFNLERLRAAQRRRDPRRP